MGGDKLWTLESARALLADVRDRTASAVEEVESLIAERETAAQGSEVAQAIERRVRDRVSRWVREMEALGVDVKGPWRVDFDSGSGSYCWNWPEEKLEYYHGYDEGFAGRVRIQ